MHIFLLHLTAAAKDGSIAFWFFVRDAPEWLLRLFLVPISTNFFVLLSGFVLTYVYTNDEGALKTPARQFMWLRLTRILPVYALSLLIAGPVYFLLKERTTLEAIQSTLLALTLTQAYFPNHAVWWNGPAWYFSVMVLTYVAFPPLVRRIQPLSRPTLWTILCVCMAIAVAPAAAHQLFWPPAVPGPSPLVNIIKFNPILWLPNFAAGMITARLFLSSAPALLTPDSGRPPRTFAALIGPSELAAAAVFVVAWVTPEKLHLLLRQGLIAPLLLALLVGLAQGRGLLARLLSSGLFRAFGESAFGIFALHMPLVTAILRIARGPIPPEGTLYGHWAELILFLVGIPVVALLVYRYFEVPVIKMLRALADRTPPGVGAG